MTCYIIEVDAPNIITHNKYYKCVTRSFLTKSKCTSNCTGHRNRVTNFKKFQVFTTLSPKFVFENTQIACSLIMKYGAFM
jgi:hypothetical protein